MPEFKVCDQTKKPQLLEYCLANEELRQYLPDKEKLTEISRSFLLSVRKNFIIFSWFIVKIDYYGTN